MQLQYRKLTVKLERVNILFPHWTIQLCIARKNTDVLLKFMENSTVENSLMSNATTDQQASTDPFFGDEEKLLVLCQGYLRQGFMKINLLFDPSDISSIVIKMLATFWKWFPYVKRDRHPFSYPDLKCGYPNNCGCFFRSTVAMIPKSGIYTIKFKVNQIDDSFGYNVIGISCNQDRSNNSQFCDLWYYSNEYIGWCVNGRLLYGGDRCRSTNIFYKNKFIHHDQNNYFQIRNGKTITFIYDSYSTKILMDNSDNQLLSNSSISNLPKDKTFYWFIGHYGGKLSITILHQSIEIKEKS